MGLLHSSKIFGISLYTEQYFLKSEAATVAQLG
jgi:hypothetical protein